MNFRIAKKYPQKNGDSALLNHSSETKEKDHQLAELKWIEEQRKNAAEEARAAAEEVRKRPPPVTRREGPYLSFRQVSIRYCCI
jgi:hypothetical protein